MSVTADIDTGGTFTDGFFTDGEKSRMVKVETTPHDLTVCFRECMEAGARALGYSSTEEMLERTAAVKFSSTIATNMLIQRSGPKLGVMVTRGHEEDLYGERTPPSLFEGEILQRGMVVGIKGGVLDDGEMAEPDIEEVRMAAGSLLTAGARAIVVCLKGAFRNPGPERRVKEILLEDYPRHYLGAVPVFLSSELCTRDGDAIRLNTVVLNAYFHRELARYLYKAEDDLRQRRLRRPLLIVHSTGGAARVAKTTALHTYNSGPVAGFLGACKLGETYGLDDLVSVDMGGTSTDIGVISGGRVQRRFNPTVSGIPVSIPMIEILTIGGGGGSIARPDDEGVRVGPDSAGALPGPACYGLGGSEPTVTDADLVLGFINPHRFLGGRRALDIERSVEAIGNKVAVPLGISVPEAAQLIKKEVDRLIATAIEGEIIARGLDPKGFSLFVYGGAGACHCCGFGEGFRKLYVFPFSAVFSAFGASTLDVIHIYERVVEMALREGSDFSSREREAFNAAVEEMRKAALRDMRGEGLDVSGARFVLELDLSGEEGGERATIVRTPLFFLKDEADDRRLRELCSNQFERPRGGEGSAPPPVVIRIRALRLVATHPLGRIRISESRTEGEDPSGAIIGEREVFWTEGRCATPVYDWGMLRCGNVVSGPAIVEQDDTTCVIPRGYRLTMDRFLNGVIEREGDAGEGGA